MEEGSLGDTSLIGIEILFLQVDSLLLNFLVVDSRKFDDDCSLTYTTWIEQEFHFLFVSNFEGHYILHPPPLLILRPRDLQGERYRDYKT
jgi:hypothetical protein